jgi:alpha-L-fucosidase
MREDELFMAELPPWRHRRYGLFVQANLASVPAWAPIGLDASRYLDYLNDPALCVEVTAHHQSRWDHVNAATDFLPLLDFGLFDPQQWIDLARTAGMNHIVQVAKDTDGLCWWDAPATDLRAPTNVTAAFAAACERNQMAFGTAFAVNSTEDLSDQRAQITDLVERIGSRYLLGISPQHRLTDVTTALCATYPDLVVEDSTGVTAAGRLEILRGLGAGRGHNRVETAHHRLTPTQIVALLTETIAKGGSLMIAVGMGADGRLPEHHAVALRAAGSWVTAHSDLVHKSTPWTVWGDDHVRYLRTGEADDRGECLWAIDLTRRGEFAALGSAAGEITEISLANDTLLADWEQSTAGLRIAPTPGRTHRRDHDPATIAVYRVWLRSATTHQNEPVERSLFDPDLFAAPSIDLAAILAEAAPGSVVQLGEATYAGGGRIPAGLTIRGLGANRTHILIDPSRPLEIQDHTRIEFLRMEPDPLAPPPVEQADLSLLSVKGTSTTLLGVQVEGPVHVSGDDHLLRSCELTSLRGREIHHLTVSRCHFRSPQPDDGIGIDLFGGSHHLIENCEISTYRAAITCEGTDHLRVRGNAITGGIWGIRIIRCESPHLVGNTMRAITRATEIDGGSGAVIDANAVSDGDSGCLIRNGATSVIVSGNHWQHCRIGLMLWGAGEVIHHSNIVAGLLEPEHAVLIGPG